MKIYFLIGMFWSFLVNFSATAQQNFNCKNLIKINSAEYAKNKKKPEKLNRKSDLKKVKGHIKIQHLKTAFTDRNDEMEYTVEGKIKSWNLISADDFIRSYYFLVGKTKVDTLIGPPKIFGNTLLAIEEEYTDFPETIQIWDISTNGNLKLKKSFSIKNCKNRAIADAYIFENYLYIKVGFEDVKNDFYKIKI